jgi:hypothetical protein
MLPPDNEDKLAAYAIALGIEKGSSDWVTYFDLAAIAKQELPKEVKESAPEIISLLPAFLRTNGNRKISDEKLQKLIDFLSSTKYILYGQCSSEAIDI